MRGSKTSAYDRANGEAAAAILAASEQYGGAESGLVRWACLWRQRHQPKQMQGDLFEAVEVIYV